MLICTVYILIFISKENKYINIFAKYIFKAPLGLFLTTGWDWGIFQGSCAGGFTFFPSFLPRNTKPDEFVCPGMDGAVGQVRKSSNPQQKLFSFFCWLLGGHLGFFSFFPLFFHGRQRFLPCLSHLRLAAQLELEKPKFPFHSSLG